MYRVDIINNGVRSPIHLPTPTGVKLFSGTVKSELNMAQGFTFSLLPNNPGWSEIEPYKTKIEVVDLQKNNIIFYGRALDSTKEMTSEGQMTKKYVAESELGYLKDSYQPFEEIHDMSPADFFRKLIYTHNSQVGSDQQFVPGVINVSNSTDNVYRFLDDQTTWQTLNDKLVTRLGGYLFVRHESGTRFIDYLQDSGAQAPMSIQLAKNMISVSETIKATEVITRLVPLGATQVREGAEATTAQPKLKIGSVNNGMDYITDNLLEQQLNVIVYGTQTWSDVTDPNNLLTKGREWLAAQRMADSITVSALNLSTINDKFDRYQLGNTYTINHGVLGIKSGHVLSTQTINVLDPTKSELTFGDKKLDLISYQQALNDQKNADDSILAVLEKNKTNTQQQIEKMQNEIDSLKLLVGDGYLYGKIIDVSEHQGDIDWLAIKNDGVVFAIIRVQYGGNYEDNKYKQNIAGAQSAGIRYAVYGYGLYANETEAKEEAKLLFDRANTAAGSGVKPIFYAVDLEGDTPADSIRANTLAWNQIMSEMGVESKYQVAYIANHLYDQFNIDVSKFGSIWIPAYGSEPAHPYDLWQYTSTGSVAGISGNVDMNQSPSTAFKNNYLRR